jgi:NADH-quinone oxidoreductase subunit K
MDFIGFLMISFTLFFFGVAGVFLNRKNVLIVLMAVELMLLSVNFMLLIISSFLDDRYGQIFAIFILTVAAAESSIGLAILVAFYRLHGTVALERITNIKG